MWSSIENLKENLNRIALEIHDDDDEDDGKLSIYNSGDRADSNSVSDRRVSRNFAHSKSPTYHSPIANGFDSAHNPEDQVSRLNEENSSLKQSLQSSSPLSASKNMHKVVIP
ncbi:unnamed protein product [Withania somnifera]